MEVVRVFNFSQPYGRGITAFVRTLTSETNLTSKVLQLDQIPAKDYNGHGVVDLRGSSAGVQCEMDIIASLHTWQLS